MAVDGLKLGAPDVVYSELGTSGFCSSKANEPHNCERAKRCPWFYRRLISSLFLILALLYFAHPDLFLGRLLQRPRFVRNSITTTASQSEVLEVFQVYPPVVVNGSGSNGGDCKVLVMEHSFGYSYGKPFVGNYTPPTCEFNRVVMNFTVTSRGRQFDRLALMYLGDIEVWRTSTAEPTVGGIRWTYVKDMTPYLSLWQQPQKVIFDLGNLIDDTYTGPFNTTLTLNFLNFPYDAAPADLILPISARRSPTNSASVFSLPADKAITTLSLPRNAHRASISISACGQADEEFWWSNVLASGTDTFTNTTGALPGFSPWREVQVYIDGRLAGVQWPFPVVFTGGVVPGLWRPIVGIEAFDLREYEVDISPWLGLLSDGEPHTFEIKVVGITDGAGGGDSNGGASISDTVGSSWLVTGKVFLWLDEPGDITVGTLIRTGEDVFEFKTELATTNDAAGANETLSMQLAVHRELSFTSILTTASGTRTASWSQQLSYTNRNHLTKYGIAQSTNLTRSASDSLTWESHESGPGESYLLVVDSEYHIDPANARNLRINATTSCEVEYRTGGGSVFPSGIEEGVGVNGRVRTRQVGNATYVSSNGRSSGSGETKQVFVLEKVGAQAPATVYSRDVCAAGGVVVWDREVGDQEGDEDMERRGELERVEEAARSVRDILGRGPGRSRRVLVMGEERAEYL